MELNWKPAKGKVPEYEVLAVGYQDEMLVGMIYRTETGISCESDGVILDEVRYYIPLKDLRKTIPKEAK